MILEEIKNIRVNDGELRKFGIIMGVILGLLGGVLLWRGKDSSPYFLIFSLFFVASGFFIPKVLKPVYKVWMAFGIVVGWIMTRVILTALFYLVFTPIGLTARLFGKNFLSRRFDKDCQSYWLPKGKRTFEKERYENQF